MKPKKKKGFRNWLKFKIGEEPVYGQESQFKQSTLLMEQYLVNHGYFKSKVSYATEIKKKKLNVIYSVKSEGQYFIRNIYMPVDSGIVSQIVRIHEKDMEIKSGEAYNLQKLSDTRDMFATYIRSEGFFDFNAQYIFFYVDTTIGNRQLDIYFRVKTPTDTTEHQKYYINNIKVYPFYSIDDSFTRSAYDTIYLYEYKIIQPEVFLRPKALARNILIERDFPFSQAKHNYTVNHFLDLQIFKFINIKYEKVARDSLDVYMQLTPSNTQDVSGELNLSTKTGNFLGLGVNGSYINRNLFKGGERLIISGALNSETQVNSGDAFINTLEISARAEFGIPRLLTPFGKRKVNMYYIPRTKFSFMESFQKRVKYYTVNSLLFDFAYDWRKNERINHIVTPFSIHNFRLIHAEPDFNEILISNPILRTSFEDVFIIGMKYSFLHTGRGFNLNESYAYFRGNIDLAGNIFYLIANATSNGTEPHRLINRPVANYSAFDIDGRYYLKISGKHSFVSRVVAGIAVPYGNSEVIPYLKQFFIGGATSVRAYRLRTLGPGGFQNPEAENKNIFPDQTGDIKLELNAEYRFNIFKFFKGALFADGGNIWLLSKDPQRPEGEFNPSNFYKEFAIGIGAGIRLDFNFFVIRTDVSFPIRKPELPEGDRWTFDKLEFNQQQWRQDNLIWNIAIGYPF